MKRWIYIKHPTIENYNQKVCWYEGTSDIQIVHSIQMLFQFPSSKSFLLKDMDNDLVPVSSTLPHETTYQIIFASTLSNLPSPISNSTHNYIIRKRKRTGPQQDTIEYTDTIASTEVATIWISTVRSPISHVIQDFIKIFTRPISIDDNIQFIPTTGSFSLYGLYQALLIDTKHPTIDNTRESTFYKLVSLHGKLERQRLIRFYQLNSKETNEIIEINQYKPRGKGPFLRRYVSISMDCTIEELVQAIQSSETLNTAYPYYLVQRYCDFIEGFVPIAKTIYQAAMEEN